MENVRDCNLVKALYPHSYIEPLHAKHLRFGVTGLMCVISCIYRRYQSIKCACYCDDSHFIFNIGSGQGTSINRLISLIQDVTGLELNVDYKSSRLFDVPTNVLSIDKANQFLNWSPLVCSKDGITRFYKYLRDC